MAVILLMNYVRQTKNIENIAQANIFYFVCFFNKNEFTKVLDKVLILKKMVVSLLLLLLRFCLLLLP